MIGLSERTFENLTIGQLKVMIKEIREEYPQFSFSLSFLPNGTLGTILLDRTNKNRTARASSSINMSIGKLVSIYNELDNVKAEFTKLRDSKTKRTYLPSAASK